MALAREANVYLDRKAAWFQIKEDREAAVTGQPPHHDIPPGWKNRRVLASA